MRSNVMQTYDFDHTIAVVIPTKGRRTLKKCLESLDSEKQNGYSAEVIVVYDAFGEVPRGYFLESEVEELCKEAQITFVKADPRYSDWGYPELLVGYNAVRFSEYIMNIGDDDEMVEGIFPRMLNIINANGIRPYMFQAELHPSPHRGNRVPVTLWSDAKREVRRSHVTGQNLIVPNVPHLFGQMTDDFVFIESTLRKWRGGELWVPVTICRCY